MPERHLIIFVKNPVMGRVKTRIANTLGDVAALDIYKVMLDVLVHNIQNVNVVKHVFYSHFLDENDIWNAEYYLKHIQEGIDLGERMSHAFEKIYNLRPNHPKSVIIIGSDCPTISAEIIHHAFDSLESYDFVAGPTFDGGYYLLGMNTYWPEVFSDIAWSTSVVMQQTLDIMAIRHKTCNLLPILNDIDTAEDWYQYKGATH